MLGFPDARAEQAFQLHYGWPACAVGLVTTAMGLLAHGMYVLPALLSPGTCAFTAQIWHNAMSMAAGLIYLALYALLGKQRFVVGRGIHSVWQRLLFATGVLFYSRPGNCAAAGYCQLLWQHRLFLVHLVGAVARVPCGWFWVGGVVSWLAAVAVDVADPGVSCASILCLLSALQAEIADNPLGFMQEVIWTALRSSRVFAVDVVLPGLLLTWLELRARRAWWQQQQARQQEVLLQLRRDAAAHKKEQQAAAAAAAAAATTTPPAAAPSTSSSNSSTLAASGVQQQREHQPAAPTVAAMSVAKPVLCGTAAAGTAKPADLAAGVAAGPAAAHAAAPAGAVRVQQGGPRPYPAALVLPIPGLRRALPGQQRQSVLYRSPVERCTISLKFSKAPGQGPQSNALFQLQLVAAIEACVLPASPAAATHTTGDAPSQQQTKVMVTGVAAFPGCWQLVMHLVLPPSHLSNSQLQQQVQHAAQGVLEAYQADCSLLSTQLQPAVSDCVTTAAPVVTPAALVQAAAAAAAHAGVLPEVATAAGGMYMHPVVMALPGSNGTSSNSSSGDRAGARNASTVVTVCFAQPILAQPLQAGHSNVRVVVTSQLPGAPALADSTWQLPRAEAAAASALRSPGIGEAPGTAADVCLPVELQFSDLESMQQQQQPAVMSVVVLAGRVSESKAHGAAPAGVDSTATAGLDAATDTSSQHAPAAVLAKLPLLLLPAGVASELQQLYTGMIEDGTHPAAAYQELLPLLQDLAVVLSSIDAGASQQQQHDEQGMLQVLADALLLCFEQQGLVDCSKLVGPAGTAAQAAVALAGKQSDEAHAQAAIEATATAHGGGASCTSTALATSNLEIDLVQSKSAGSAPAGSSGRSSVKGSSSSTFNSARDSQEEVTGLPAGQHQQQEEVAGRQAVEAGTLTAGRQTLLRGFPAAVEPVYLSCKAAALRTTDFLSMLSYGVGLTATAVKLMCSTTDSSKFRILALQAAFLLIHAVTHVVVWAAGTGVRQLAALQQWRNNLLAGSATLAICMFAATSVQGGVWAAASLADQLGDKPGLYWVLVVNRHVMQQLRLRIGLLPLLLLVAEYAALHCLYMRPRLPWLGAAGTTLLLIAVHLAIVARLEFGMRRSFVRSL